jgi:hypothetical protein
VLTRIWPIVERSIHDRQLLGAIFAGANCVGRFTRGYAQVMDIPQAECEHALATLIFGPFWAKVQLKHSRCVIAANCDKLHINRSDRPSLPMLPESDAPVEQM